MLPKLEVNAYYIKIIGVSLVLTASCVSEIYTKNAYQEALNALELLTSTTEYIEVLASNNADLVSFDSGNLQVELEKSSDLKDTYHYGSNSYTSTSFTGLLEPSWINKTRSLEEFYDSLDCKRNSTKGLCISNLNQSTVRDSIGVFVTDVVSIKTSFPNAQHGNRAGPVFFS